jgi:hypothetical protein
VPIATYTNAIGTANVGTATATREVAGTPVVTGIVTATSTSSATSTKGGVVTDYRYDLYGSGLDADNPIPSDVDGLGAGDNVAGEYYIDSGVDNADGDDIVYVSLEVETYPEVVITEEVAASVEEYVVDVITPASVTIADTVYEERATGTTATRTAAGS